MSDIPVKERLPTYSLSQIVTLRDSLFGGLAKRYAEIAITTPDDLEIFLDDLTPYLHGRVSRATLFETFRPFMGVPYPESWWREFFWRIAGNMESLGRGTPLRPWVAPGVREWVPAQVLRIEPAPQNAKGQHRYTAQIRILAGFASAMLFPKVFTAEWLSTMSRYVGFTQMRHGRGYISPFQYTGLRVFLLLEPAHSKNGFPGFYEFRCTSNILQHNVDLLNRRYRRTEKFTCPKNFTHDCHLCAVGYMTCPAGTHKVDYVEKTCMHCGQPAWFDPEVATDMCIQCWRNKIATTKLF